LFQDIHAYSTSGIGRNVTLFEFISVMISIILGVSLAQALTGVAGLAREWPRVKNSVLHSLWTITLVLAHFLSWWAVWDYREVDWNYGRFMVALSVPLLLFFLTSLLFPDPRAGVDINLEVHFFRIRRWLMTVYSILATIWIIDGPLVFESERMLNSYRIPQSVSVLAPLLGLRSPNRTLHLGIACAVLGVILLGSMFRFFPGTFSFPSK
jgi:hypothetical protein